MQANALTVIHKFIRGELFEVSRKLASADPADLDTARAALESTATMLRGHAAHEDASFEPLLREVDPPLAARMSADHVRLEDELERICRAAAALDASERDACEASLLQLHLDWNRFVGAYLAHLDDEERTLLPAIGAEVPPVEFVAQGAASRGPDGYAFLEKVWTVVTPRERAAIEQAHRMIVTGT